MTDLIEDFRVPNPNGGEEQLEQMVSNWYFLAMVICEVADAMAGWETTNYSSSSPADFDHPDYKIVSKTYTDESPNRTVQFKYIYTWDGDDKVEIIYQFDDGTGGGFTTVTEGTLTLTYDGLGNLVSSTPS